jgi:hypothetical protein
MRQLYAIGSDGRGNGPQQEAFTTKFADTLDCALLVRVFDKRSILSQPTAERDDTPKVPLPFALIGR